MHKVELATRERGRERKRGLVRERGDERRDGREGDGMERARERQR